jgi:hypothetical protein
MEQKKEKEYKSTNITNQYCDCDECDGDQCRCDHCIEDGCCQAPPPLTRLERLALAKASNGILLCRCSDCHKGGKRYCNCDHCVKDGCCQEPINTLMCNCIDCKYNSPYSCEHCMKSGGCCQKTPPSNYVFMTKEMYEAREKRRLEQSYSRPLSHFNPSARLNGHQRF